MSSHVLVFVSPEILDFPRFLKQGRRVAIFSFLGYNPLLLSRRPTDVVVRCRGGEMFCSPVIPPLVFQRACAGCCCALPAGQGGFGSTPAGLILLRGRPC